MSEEVNNITLTSFGDEFTNEHMLMRTMPFGTSTPDTKPTASQMDTGRKKYSFRTIK